MRNASNILVTGGAGFIGSHLVDRLLAEGFDVTILDDFSTGIVQNISHREKVKQLRLVRGDIRNPKVVRRAVKDVDSVFHEAAVIEVSHSIKNPLLFNEINLVGTLNLLKASVDFDVKRFVFASSAAVYGDAKTAIKREDMLPEPISPYAVSKLAAEYYVQVFNRLYGLKTVSLRYFNVYGPRQGSASYGGVITAFVARLLNGQPPIIHGDGYQTRDFVHVDDVVSANMLALRSSNAVGKVLNIASGTSTTVLQLAKILGKITNTTRLRPRFTSNIEGDIKHSLGDITKARKTLEFHPKVTLNDGLSRLVEWHMNMIHASNQARAY